MWRFICHLLLLFPLSALYSQKSAGPIGIPIIQNYSTDDYKEHEQNWAVTQDHRGIMYFGNTHGILEYDGSKWRYIITTSPDIVRSLAVNEDNKICVGGHNYFGFLDTDSAGNKRYFPLDSKLREQDKTFRDIWKTYANRHAVYFQSNTALFIWSNDSIRIIKPEKRFHLSFMINEVLHIREIGVGLKRMGVDSLHFIPNSEIFADKRVYLMCPVKEKSILIGTRNDGFFIYNGKDFKPFITEVDQYIRNNKLYGGTALADGFIALATLNGGLVIINENGELSSIITKEKGMRNNKVWSAFYDKRSGLWLALDNGISHLLFPSPISIFNENSGLDGTVETITKYRGELFIGSSQGLHKYNKQTRMDFLPVLDITYEVRNIIEHNGYLYANETGSGIWKIKGNKKQKMTDNFGYSIKFSQFGKDLVIQGTSSGIRFYREDRNRWIELGKIDLNLGPIRNIEELANGDLWLGTSQNIIYRMRFKTTSNNRENLLLPEIELFGEQHGLPDSKQYYVFRHRDGLLFSTEYGLYRFDEERKYFYPDSTFGEEFTRGERSVRRMAEDRWGNTWMWTGAGGRYESGVAVPGESGAYKWHGTKFLPLSKAVFYAIYPDEDQPDLVWFGGPDGLVRFDQSIKSDFSGDFSTLIRSVIIREDSLVYTGARMDKGKSRNETSRHIQSVLDYANNALRFEFSSTSYTDEKENRYKYYLKGVDGNWSNWSNEPFAIYTNVPEGKYLFRVMGKNIYDVESSEGTYAFEILPPWYRTWIAYIVYAVLIIGLIFTMVKLRSLQLEREKKNLEKIIAERTEEIQQKNIQLAEQAEKLKAQDETKSRFFANISHEFRTPLTLIVGPTEEMLKDEYKGDKNKAHRIIANNARRLLRLINQLLDLSKLESGNMELKASLRELTPFLKMILDSFSSLAESRNIHLHFHEPETEIQLYFDEDKMEKVLYNLLSNAFKYTPENGHIAIAVHPYSDNTYPDGAIEISVHDSGIGMSGEDITAIFDRFSRGNTTANKRVEGSGIGLALTKELVELHHGTISVTSKPGEGTEFDVVLPLGRSYLRENEILKKTDLTDDSSGYILKEIDELRAEIEHEKIEEKIKVETENPVVLIVEDNADVRDYIKTHLADDFEILESDDGKAGVEKALEELPDLIISDIMMPEMDGYELTDKLKNDPLSSHIPIILLTAKAADVDRIEGLQTGADAYMSKPFNAKELEVRVSKLIEGRVKLREKFRKDLLLEPDEVEANSMEDEFLMNIHQRVEKNMAYPEYNAEALQRESGFSKSQFYRKLYALTGHTPGQYIRTMRLKRAMQLIKQKSGTISQIAFESGFNNLSYFSKCFKEQFGKLPSEV